MKIGILTLPLHTNYGGILQAYALQTVLERMGHEVVVINRNFHIKKYPPLWRFPLSITKRCIRKYLLRQNVNVFSEYHQNKTYKTISQHTQKFINQYIHTLTINKLEELNEKDFNCIIVGSDQVWRKKYFSAFYKTTIDNAFLSFARNWKIKKIAYAASFGTNEWEYDEEETYICKELANLFQAISVREDSGVFLCKKYLYKAPTLVLDPTMLLTKDDYIKSFISKKNAENKKKLFYYILDKDEKKSIIVEQIAKKLGLTPSSRFSNKKEKNEKYNNKSIIPPLEDWLSAFNDAEYVVTDSFHGVVFSIIFNRPFTVILNEKRGIARFESLLKMFQLEERIYSPNKGGEVSVINWSVVNTILSEKRVASNSFLKNLINKK